MLVFWEPQVISGMHCRMMAATLDGGPEKPPSPRKGRTSLQTYIGNLVTRSEATPGAAPLR